MWVSYVRKQKRKILIWLFISVRWVESFCLNTSDLVRQQHCVARMFSQLFFLLLPPRFRWQKYLAASRKTSLIREDKFGKSTLTFGLTNINDAILHWLPTCKNPQSMRGHRWRRPPGTGRRKGQKCTSWVGGRATAAVRSQAMFTGRVTIYWLLLLNYTSIQ